MTKIDEIMLTICGRWWKSEGYGDYHFVYNNVDGGDVLLRFNKIPNNSTFDLSEIDGSVYLKFNLPPPIRYLITDFSPDKLVTKMQVSDGNNFLDAREVIFTVLKD